MIYFPVTISLLFVFFLNCSQGQKPFPDKYTVKKGCDVPMNLIKPNANGEWPVAVESPRFWTTAENKRIRLDITWIGEIKNVKGFKLVLTADKSWCRVFDLSDAVSNSSSGKYLFAYHFKNIYKQKVYKGELYPLPSLGNNSVRAEFNTLGLRLLRHCHKCKQVGLLTPLETQRLATTGNDETRHDPDLPLQLKKGINFIQQHLQNPSVKDCSIYSPSVNYDYDGRNMNVTFTKGTPSCHYKKYEVTLYKNVTFVTSKIVPTQENVDKLQTHFEVNICSGKYFIMVGVYDENWSDSSACVCKNVYGSCQRCSNNVSEIKYLIPEKSCVQKPKPSKKMESNLFIPLAIVMGILLLITLALTFAHWKLSVHLMVKKCGIVLLLDDHEHHTNAVSKLINYLNESHLKVLLGSTLVKNHDAPDQLRLMVEILKADFVLLVLSSALQKRMAAWDKHQDYVDFFKERNSNIITKILLEMLLTSNNLYVCKFDHVAEFGNWPKPCYSLPSNLSNMVADLNGQTYSQRLALCNCFKSKTLWNEFQTAIKKACIYEQSHVNWFQEKYVCPTNQPVLHFITDETSQESQHTYPKLKGLFSDYQNNYPNLPEEHVITPSVFSEPISEKLEAINNRNL